MDSIYRENILDHFRNPRNFGRLKKKDLSHEEYNPFCGDRIGMEIKVKSPAKGEARQRRQKSKVKSIEDIRFYGEGCAISLASASMLTEKVKSMDIERAKELTTDDILVLLGISLTPTRLKCALLPLEVLQKTSRLVKEE